MKFRHVVVDSLFIVAPIVCEGFVFGVCIGIQNLVSFLALQSSCRRREYNCLPNVL